MKKLKKYHKPKLPFWLLQIIADNDQRFPAMGDLEEMYFDINQKGKFIAWLWIWKQVLFSMPYFLIHSINWNLIMLKNYFKIALRNILKNKSTSFINIGGLSLGLACCIIMILYIQYDLTFDKFHSKSNRIFRLIENQRFSGQTPKTLGQTMPWMGETMVDAYPEIVSSVNFITIGDVSIRQDKNFTTIENVLMADPDIFEVFDFELLEGNPSTALTEPYTVVLTEEVCNRIYKDKDPIGELFRPSGWDKDYKITGILKVPPKNSHIQFTTLISIMETRLQTPSWNNLDHYSPTYFLLKEGINPKTLEDKLPAHVQKFMPNDAEKVSLHLQPLKDIHLLSQNIMWEINHNKGDRINVIILLSIVLFIFLIVYFNYINISLSQMLNRVKEMSVRKVIGAFRIQLIKQFSIESILYTLLAFIIALNLIVFILPILNNFLEQSIKLSLKENWILLGFIFFIMTITCMIAHVFPAILLSTVNTSDALKGIFVKGSKVFFVRKFFVITQFAISIGLIISTVVVFLQSEYMRHSDIGFDKSQIISLPINGWKQNQFETIRQELLKNPSIVSVTAATRRLGLPLWRNAILFEGMNPNEQWISPYMAVDYDFISLYGLSVSMGRDFSRKFTNDIKGKSFIINQTLKDKLGWNNPIGKRFRIANTEWGTVIGIVKDFNHRSLHHTVEPIVLFIRPSMLFNMSIRIGENDITASLEYIEQLWKKYHPNVPFQYSFLNKDYERLYQNEVRSNKLFATFTVLAIIISCLGLFALASFAVKKKTKEIGIRKVLGSSESNIFWLLSKDFIKWIVMANFIAWPMAYFIMNSWLQNFAYRIDISVYIFTFASLITLIVGLITVSFHTIKAAIANPIESLRYE